MGTGTRHERQTMEEDFRDFVTARSAALLRTAYLLAGDWATAEDLLQTALTKTYLAWKRLGQIEAVEPYARRVLVNTATSWWRRRWHGERPTEFLPERAAPDRLDEQLDRDVLWRHVKALPARQRAVLVLRFYEDMSEAQTAALLNISAGTVKSQTSRALGTLRQRLAAEGLEPVLPGAAAASGSRSDTTRSDTTGWVATGAAATGSVGAGSAEAGPVGAGSAAAGTVAGRSVTPGLGDARPGGTVPGKAAAAERVTARPATPAALPEDAERLTPAPDPVPVGRTGR